MDTGETTLAFCNHGLAEAILKAPYNKASLKEAPLGSQITFAPEDVKASYKMAIENGAESVSEPKVKPWNFEVAIVRDCDGHVVELAKNLNWWRALKKSPKSFSWQNCKVEYRKKCPIT